MHNVSRAGTDKHTVQSCLWACGLEATFKWMKTKINITQSTLKVITKVRHTYSPHYFGEIQWNIADCKTKIKTCSASSKQGNKLAGDFEKNFSQNNS